MAETSEASVLDGDAVVAQLDSKDTCAGAAEIPEFTNRFAVHELDEELSWWILRSCASSGESRNAFIRRQLRRAFEGVGSREPSLEEAADKLLTAVTPEVRAGLLEVADHDQRIERWKVIMGLVNLAWERGELHAGSPDPAWVAEPLGAKDQKGVARCARCQTEFHAKRPGQLVPEHACERWWRRRSRSEEPSEICPFRGGGPAPVVEAGRVSLPAVSEAFDPAELASSSKIITGE